MSSMNLQDEQSNELLFVGFNQDYGCFACGTDTGKLNHLFILFIIFDLFYNNNNNTYVYI